MEKVLYVCTYTSDLDEKVETLSKSLGYNVICNYRICRLLDFSNIKLDNSTFKYRLNEIKEEFDSIKDDIDLVIIDTPSLLTNPLENMFKDKVPVFYLNPSKKNELVTVVNGLLVSLNTAFVPHFSDSSDRDFVNIWTHEKENNDA